MKIKSILNIFVITTLMIYLMIDIFMNNTVFGYVSNIFIVVVCISLIILNIVANIKKYNTIKKLMIVISTVLTIFCTTYITLYRLDILHIFSSVELLKEFIISTKEKGIIIYILIQILQVVFVPIPAAVIAIVGSIIYGPWLGAVYCSIGILLGSYISYIIGKTFGYRVVSWMVGESNAHKYGDILCKRGAFFLIVAFLLPLFPDDILCLIAGISTMKFSTFFLVTTLTRPIGVIFMCVFGSGQVIPYSGWGIIVWCAIIILAVSIVILLYKYQDKLQGWIYSKLKINTKI